MQHDVVIVGAGPAGCVMANRLSADPSCRVLLLETGPVFPPDRYPEELLDADRITRTGTFTWGYRGEAGAHNPAFDVAAARVAGGGSAVNAANIRRARADDLERWADRGVEGWSYDDVLQTYKDIENTPDDSDAAHGRAGLLPVRQMKPADATEALRAFVGACAGSGFAEIEDYNGQDQHGVAFMARNVVGGVRVNAGIAYLTAEVRARPNLDIRFGVQADRILFDGNRATGLRLPGGETLQAREVVLCAGAYGSPVVLMRSGIGPAAHLADHGIPVVTDLPVGDGLRDHPVYFSTYALKSGVTRMHPAAGAVLATRSAEASSTDLDLWVFAYNLRIPPVFLGRPMLMIGASVVWPLSRGTVRLRSPDPVDPPRIQVNLLADPADRRRMLEAVRLAGRVARTEPLAALVRKETAPGPDVTGDADLLKAVEGALTTFDHGSCTARMGRAGDPEAVTGRTGRVHGVESLRVVEASIFPDTLSVPINLSVMMLAERSAGGMRATRAQGQAGGSS